MPRVHVLSPQLASQIAAGEVVERPASALKELLENALDAGARRCDVTIEGGGIALLSVRDDGCGMAPEDAVLALSRHATSKLNTFDDLNGVRSYGFRGEALPSIASVSRFTLRTRPAEMEAGTEVRVEGGAEPALSDVGMAVGTQIEVRDLFYNVPARRKFLRSSATEAGHIVDVVENAALACPDVTFTLERDGRRAREWLRAPSRAERVASVFADEDFTSCAGEKGPLLLEAYLGRPERARSGAAGLKLFCNSRPIRDRALLTTLAQAFGSVLERGRYPRGVVYIDLPPELVDVNVHPQKTEVRFADARAVTDAVYQLTSAHLAKAFSLPPKPRTFNAASPPANPSPNPSAEGQRGAPSVPAAGDTSAAFSALSEPRVTPVEAADAQGSSVRVADVPASAQQWLGLSEGKPGAPLRPSSTSESQPPAQTAADAVRRPAANGAVVWSRLRFVAQVRATYLLCEGDDALYIIDQHAAAERVTFHRLREQYRTRSLTSQSLLFPVALTVTAEQSELLESKQEEVKQLGFEIRVHGENTASLHGVPKLLQRGSPERLAFDLLSELSRAGRGFSDAVDLVLSTMACHGSIRSGDALSEQEARALLQALDQVDFSGHCPHGRPIVASTPWAELERRVGRR